MTEIKYQIVSADDYKTINLIAGWYLSEWNIPKQITIKKIKRISVDGTQFQVLMTIDNIPIATGGLYDHVGILDREPRLKVFKNWLALVYTTPENRNKGYGALICNDIQKRSKTLRLKDIYLFTHTAKNFYKRLGWQQLERLALGGKEIVVMKKEL